MPTSQSPDIYPTEIAPTKEAGKATRKRNLSLACTTCDISIGRTWSWTKALPSKDTQGAPMPRIITNIPKAEIAIMLPRYGTIGAASSKAAVRLGPTKNKTIVATRRKIAKIGPLSK